MSEDKQADNDPERTLVTLEQLSQTIEVMTSVVNRLRKHLSAQLAAKSDAGQPQSCATEPPVKAEKVAETQSAHAEKQESFVVEISQQESQPRPKSDKTLH